MAFHLQTALIACLTLPLAACSMGAAPPAATPIADDAGITLSGEPVRCLNTSMIQNSTVVDKQTIDFRVGSKTYRNRLDSYCPSINRNDPIIYDSHGGQLCSNDIVYGSYSVGGDIHRSGGCGLGEFQPIKKVK